MKVLSNSDKIKALIAPNMEYITTFLDNNKNRISAQGKIFMDHIII